MTMLKINKNDKIPLLILIIVNLLPIFGVIFLSWKIDEIIFLYWFENIVIGLFNILKMSKSEVKATPQDTEKANLHVKKIFLIYFFIFHYSFFTLIHGIFIFDFFIKENILNYSIIWAILSLFISHGISYIKNYLGSEEYKKVDTDVLMFQPYKRIVVIHITIILGGILVEIFGNNFLALLILIFIKIFLDIKLHKKEHQKFQERTQFVLSSERN